MFIPSYRAIESSEMISAFSRSANSTPTWVLPAAVGPVRYQQSTAGGTGEGALSEEISAKKNSAIAGRGRPLYDDSNLVPADWRAVQLTSSATGGLERLTVLCFCCESAYVQRPAPAHVGPGGPQDQPAAQLLYRAALCGRRHEDRGQDYRGSPRAGRGGRRNRRSRAAAYHLRVVGPDLPPARTAGLSRHQAGRRRNRNCPPLWPVRPR